MPGLIESIASIWPGSVVSPSRSLKWIVPLIPVTGPNGAARSRLAVEKSPLEVTFPPLLQSIRPRPLMVPLTSAITPAGQAREVVGLEARAEGQAGDVEVGMAKPARQPVLEVDVHDPDPRPRLPDRAVGADEIAGDGHVQIVADQGIEARIGEAVGDLRARVDAEVAVI